MISMLHCISLKISLFFFWGGGTDLQARRLTDDRSKPIVVGHLGDKGVLKLFKQQSFYKEALRIEQIMTLEEEIQGHFDENGKRFACRENFEESRNV